MAACYVCGLVLLRVSDNCILSMERDILEEGLITLFQDWNIMHRHNTYCQYFSEPSTPQDYPVYILLIITTKPLQWIRTYFLPCQVIAIGAAQVRGCLQSVRR